MTARMILAVALVLLWPGSAQAMHLSEGILPLPFAGLWFLLSLPFVAAGLRNLRRRSAQTPELKALVGLVGAGVFIISCMPIPVATVGTTSHPCGTGLAAILIGPSLTVVVSSVALTLQALFLAHGGLTTLGANVFSMGVAGAYVGYGAFRLALVLGAPAVVAAFLAGILSDWATYSVTALELASALGAPGKGGSMFVAVLVAFVPTQLPLGVLEGFLSAIAYRFVRSRRAELLDRLLEARAR